MVYRTYLSRRPAFKEEEYSEVFSTSITVCSLTKRLSWPIVYGAHLVQHEPGVKLVEGPGGKWAVDLETASLMDKGQLFGRLV